jgi:hypothetical protein
MSGASERPPAIGRSVAGTKGAPSDVGDRYSRPHRYWRVSGRNLGRRPRLPVPSIADDHGIPEAIETEADCRLPFRKVDGYPIALKYFDAFRPDL